MDETQVFGDVDFISVKGASVIEGMIWDFSLLAGYTIDLSEELKLRLGVGAGFFHGFQPKSNTTSTAMGSILSLCLDYFFISGLGISVGIEDGVYGSVRKKQPDEKHNNSRRIHSLKCCYHAIFIFSHSHRCSISSYNKWNKLLIYRNSIICVRI